MKLGGEVVHNERSVSTGAFSLNGRDSSYIMSAKKAVLKVHTLGCKSTNMQSTYFHNPAGQQYNSSLLVWRVHDMPSKLSLAMSLLKPSSSLATL